MQLSIIICTYQRVNSVGKLLDCLEAQTTKAFEVLLIDGSAESSTARRQLLEMVSSHRPGLNIQLLGSAKGLTRQRNAGLSVAKGDLILFLDDDVTFDSDFVAQALTVLEVPGQREAGGATAYDIRNHGQKFNWRWRLRSALGVAPALVPGKVDRLGRSIPVGFMHPFTGIHEVGYLPGHCMLYRRAAIGELRFDETLMTYAGEDRDFSSRVGRKWRLLMCGDWKLEHHCAPESRDSSLQRIHQAGFGLGRSFRQNASRAFDGLQFLHQVACEFALDAVACFWRPTREKLQMPFARCSGFLAGHRSARPRHRGVS